MLRTVPDRPGLRSRPRTGPRVFAVEYWFDRAARVIATYLQRSRTRRALAELPDHHLSDIGLSRSDVARETSKPFWR